MMINDMGKLMHLPLADIRPGLTVATSPYIVQAAATALQQANGRNWVPLIVKQVDQYCYEVISQGLVYAIAQAAQLERVWCIVTDASPETIALTHILAGEQLPKVNLSTASYPEIWAALEFACEQSSALKGMDHTAVAEALMAANRQNWQNLTPITKLGKFKFGKSAVAINGKRLHALATVFDVVPPEPIAAPPVLTPIQLKKATRPEIFAQLQRLASAHPPGFEQLDLEKIADEIFTEPKTKWKSLTPLTKLNCGITAAHVKVMKQIFTLS
jgi:hypothetical protein